MRDDTTQAARTDQVPVRFTNMQWYLSHAGNTVHLVAFLDRTVPRAEFAALVNSCFDHFPALGLGEDRAAERFTPPGDPRRADSVWQHRVVPALGHDPTGVLSPEGDLFDRSDRPAFRARCDTLADDSPGAPRTRLHFVASHSLVEGADLAAALRGRTDRRGRRPQAPNGLSRFAGAGLALAAPVLAVLHAGMAKTERRKPGDFHFACVEMDRADLAAAAERHGLSKRALLFAMALFTLAGPRPRRRALRVAYSKLPARQAHLEDDAWLSVRMQTMSARPGNDFDAFAQALATALKRQNETEVLSQFLANRVLRVHRRIASILPWVYRGPFFGFSPYDMVLSLVPPIAPGGAFSALGEARLFGGSYTGTVPSVVYLCDARRVTWTCWLERAQADRLDDLARLAEAEGIGCHVWRQEPPGTDARR